MTNWIDTLFDRRAAVGGEQRSQELTFKSQASSWRPVVKKLHLLPQVLDGSIPDSFCKAAWKSPMKVCTDLTSEPSE